MKTEIALTLALVAITGAILYTQNYSNDTFLAKLSNPEDNVTWNTAQWTWYTSYAACCPNNPNYDPKADKSECDDYSACKYSGDFAYIDHKSFDWVKSNKIVAFYDDSDPNGKTTGKKYGGKNIILQVNGQEHTAIIADTCGNNDCNNCCRKNSKGGYLLDMEYWTVKATIGSTSKVGGTIKWRLP